MVLKRRIIPLGVGLVLALAVLALYVVGTPFLDLIELKALDALFLARGEIAPKTNSVAVVAIDERSLDEEGRWPWPREKVAALIQAISDQGARAIGLDMGFFEPDNRFDAQAVLAISQAAEKGKPLSVEEIVTQFHPDYVLAQTMAAVEAEVVLGYFFHMTKDAVAHVPAEEIKARRKLISKFAYPAVRFRTEAAMDWPLITAYAPENNQPILIEAVRTGGYFNVLPEPDGVVRRIPFVIQCRDRYFPALSLATLAAFLGQQLPVVDIHDFGLESLQLGPIKIPVDEKGRMWINFRGGTGLVDVFEASDVMRGRLPPGTLKDKAILVGASATGIGDVKATPFEAVQPGVEVHAQAMDNVLAGDFLIRPTWAAIFDMAAILALGLAATVLLGFLRPVIGWPVALGLGVGYVILGYQLFLGGHLLNLIHPLLALAAAGVALTVYRYLTEEREKKWVRHAFQHYLNPSVIAQVLKDPSGLMLGGQKKVLTVLFSDIRGFTTISEGLEPEVLSQALNTYLDKMTAIVFDREGVLDKYIGDAVMAIWGAPMEQPDHASRACRAALEMMAEVNALHKVWDEMRVPYFKIGIGLNTGPMVVGNLGSRLRFDYTVIGDNVNLGSRLEGQTKGYGVNIIVSQSTQNAAQEDYFFRVLDLIRVKGKKEPVAIYELVGPRDGREAPRFVTLAEEAFRAYRQRDFEGAVRLLEQVLEEKPEDAPAQLLKERCRDFLQEPPPEDWDGVETKTTK